MTILALIPARGGSKGIPRKNIREFCGKPLLQWSIDAALESESIDHIVVSTDDAEIAELAISCGAQVPFMRPSEHATDSAPGIAPVIHALDNLPQVSDVLLLQPTSPLRTCEDIDCIISLRKQAEVQSAITQSPNHPAWMYSLDEDQRLQPMMGHMKPANRQQLPSAYVLNGALYLATRSFLMSEYSFVNDQTIPYVMPVERSVDIDTFLDWKWAEFLMGQQK